MLSDLLIISASLFHNVGPLCDALFKVLFGFINGSFDISKDDRVFISLGSAGK